jgi:oligopeptide/dipeptide ABC transporter ATP-binding protein
VRGVDLQLRRHETLGIAGESGSGKSTMALAVARLLRPPARVTAGSVRLFQHDGTFSDVLSLSGRALRDYRWAKVAVVFQSAMNVLNPVLKVSEQLTDVIAAHEPDVSPAERTERAARLLDLVEVDRSWLKHYPHELSGGMRQRVIIALALALRPELVILDEPTTALDVVSQAKILTRMRTLQSQLGFAMLLITHDLPLLLCTCDRVAIMYAGKLVEAAHTQALSARQAHPYTAGLMRCFPPLRGPKARVRSIPGFPPRLSNLPTGCAFHPRCQWAEQRCKEADPPLELLSSNPAQPSRHVACWRTQEVLATSQWSAKQPERGAAPPYNPTPSAVLRAEHITKYFETSWQRAPFAAVRDVSLEVHRARTLSIVGESGSGKTTLARVLTGLTEPSSGKLWLEGRYVQAKDIRSLPLRHHVQMVFQDPFAALNPAHNISYHLTRPLKLNQPRLAKSALKDKVAQLLTQVHLVPPEEFLNKYPYELSGGQLQRVVVAKALAVQPSVLVADEPISMLDVSIRVGVLELLEELKDQGLAIVYITHDIASARYFGDEILVMYRGQVVERGAAGTVVLSPAHPYTVRLISGVPDIDFASPDGPKPMAWSPDIASLVDLSNPQRAPSPRGCSYRHECPLAFARCEHEEPTLVRLEDGRESRCFLAQQHRNEALPISLLTHD